MHLSLLYEVKQQLSALVLGWVTVSLYLPAIAQVCVRCVGCVRFVGGSNTQGLTGGNPLYFRQRMSSSHSYSTRQAAGGAIWRGEDFTGNALVLEKRNHTTLSPFISGIATLFPLSSASYVYGLLPIFQWTDFCQMNSSTLTYYL